MKKIFILMAGILLMGSTLYAGNGDLIVNGKLGVGTTTPDQLLDIRGSIVMGRETQSVSQKLVGLADISGSIGGGAGMFLETDVNGNTDIRLQSHYWGVDYGTMSLKYNGKVGIGSTNPSQRLDVSGSIAIAEGAGIAPASFSHDAGHDNTIYFGQNGGSFGGIKVINYYDGSYNNQYLTFETHHGGVSAGERMRIDRDGNVGIGITSLDPTYRLTINGKGLASDGTWEPSDIKLKKNILPVDGALDKILKLDGVSYEWKHDKDFEGETLEALKTDEDGKIKDDKYRNLPEGRTLGVIAQELEKVLPEAVSTGEDGIKAVSYAKIIPVLIEAMKEQQKQITAQQKEIEQLKNTVAKSK